MGDYTGLRFKGILKKKFREDFEIIALEGEWSEHVDTVIQKFSEVERSFLIPCGVSSYFPNEWIDKNDKATDGFETSYNKETGYWIFQCSLKNYKNTIQEFFSILPYFIEKIEYLEYYYEEDDFSKQYSLIDGKIKLINDKFKKYK